MSYTKLFSHIVTSSIWSEDDQTRILWITMLALADKHGEVMASIPGLAKVSGLTIEATQKGIEKFLSPDPYSRTPDEQGRRIEVIDGGWLLINYAKHRRMASLEEKREKNAARQRRHRERSNANSNAKSRTVTSESRTSNDTVTLETDNADADSEVSKETRKVSKRHRPEIEEFENELKQMDAMDLWTDFLEVRKKKGGAQTDASIHALLKELFKHPLRIKAGLEKAVRSSWRGFEWDWIDVPRNGNSHNAAPAKKAPREV